MLLPALGKAREKGKAIKCINNLKQIHLAAGLYVGDYETRRVPTNGWGSGYWQSNLVYNNYLPLPKYWGSGIPEGFLACDSEQRKTSGTLSEWNTWKGTHYGINWFLGQANYTSSNNKYRWHPNERMPFPSKVMYFGDKSPQFSSEVYYDDNPGRTDLPSYFRHQNKMNYVFVDGHAGSGGKDKVPTQMVLGDYAWKYHFWLKRTYFNIGGWLDM